MKTDLDMFDIRRAELADLDAISMIWAGGWKEVHEGRVPEALLAHRQVGELRRAAAARLDQTCVAARGRDVAGFVIVHRDEIEHLYVSKEARGAGAADMLLARAESLIAACSSRAWLAVVGGNERARRFYERHGWRPDGGFVHQAKVANGTVPVPTERYEKQLRQAPAQKRADAPAFRPASRARLPARERRCAKRMPFRRAARGRPGPGRGNNP
jgi:ribosomal protein S18 acetylase RimI-like enzyme